MMNVLLIGGGGREHALGWKLRQSRRCGKLYFAPGNAGTAGLGRNVNLSIEPVTQKVVDGIAHLCRHERIELVVIGPEDPLAQGLADRLGKAGLKVFGPGAAGARLEADKAWAKALMRAASIPTAESRTFESAEQALSYVRAHETPVVVKASGLAKGKGVTVCDDAAGAAAAVRSIMIDRVFGEAGVRVVVEERLVGQEVSILALVDGRNIYVLEPSQDHKQVGEGDTGPNTGGMGAYTPTPLVDDKLMSAIERDVLVPAVDALRREGIDYRGVMYAGLMLTAGGIKVIEFNCRFGDPEIQPLVLRMNGDLLEAMLAVADGDLSRVDLRWDDRVACCVVVCSGGYPGEYRKGLRIEGLDEVEAMDDVMLFHAGTKLDEDGKTVLTAGGRVLNIVALGRDLPEARDRANAACAKVKFDGAFFRHDIGDRVLKRDAAGGDTPGRAGG
jgi:phosphoribosylamine--glycine ligase